MTKINLAIAVVASLSIVQLADGAYQITPNAVPTNLPGVTASVAPPETFDPVRATDEELTVYGFPPRPDAVAAPDAYRAWERAIRASKVRVVPKLKLTNVVHGPKRRAGDGTQAGTGTSYNWSGSVDFSSAASYNKTTSFHYIQAEWVVPVAAQAFGFCTNGWDYSSSWVGIDGDGSADVLQAGTESDAYCSNQHAYPVTSTSYYAWYEWFPNYSTQISNFPIYPGDDVYVAVWSISATQGSAYLTNLNTNQSVSLNFTAPSGTLLIGNSAEWVVERPSVGGALATLTNYIADYFSNCYAAIWSGTSYLPGSSGALQLTMLDNQGHPISYPTLLGTSAIWFQDEGSAE